MKIGRYVIAAAAASLASMCLLELVAADQDVVYVSRRGLRSCRRQQLQLRHRTHPVLWVWVRLRAYRRCCIFRPRDVEIPGTLGMQCGP